jgi:hypothetical protein
MAIGLFHWALDSNRPRFRLTFQTIESITLLPDQNNDVRE